MYEVDVSLETELDKIRYIGKTFTSKRDGGYIVLGVLKNWKKLYKDKIYVVEFLKTKNKYLTNPKSLKNNTIRDSEMLNLNIKIGDRFYTTSYGGYVISNILKDYRNRTIYECEFDEYNNIKFKKLAYKKEIISKNIKNLYFPNICGVGYIGEINNYDKNIYAIWQQMIHRCYNKNHKSYKTYGGVGISICKEWHNFTNFHKDYINLPNYIKGIRQDLDKDVLQQGVKCYNKVYSKNTCMLISPSDNSKEMSVRSRQKWFMGISPNKESFIDNNLMKFSIEKIGKTITFGSKNRDNILKYKDWIFKYLTPEELKNYQENNILPHMNQ